MRISQFCIAALLSVVSANASDTSNLKPAFLDDGSKNGLVVCRPHVMPSPAIDDPVRLISISRQVLGLPFRSPEQDAYRLFKFLKSNEGFLPSMINTLIGSENEVSFQHNLGLAELADNLLRRALLEWISLFPSGAK